MPTWSVCTDAQGNKVYINLNNVLFLIRYPDYETTKVVMVGDAEEFVREEPDSIAIAGVDVGQ